VESTRDRHDRLVEARPLAHGVALRAARSVCPHLDADEVRAVADHALVEAWQHFDPSRGCTFTTYAYEWVRGAALRVACRARWRQSVSSVLDEEQLSVCEGPGLETRIAARRALRRVPYRDRGLVFDRVVLGEPFARMAARGGVSVLRRRFRRALGSACGPWRRRR
jgi:DNA-directed RNA polymerase specialized sigma24 family protein